MRIEDYPPQDPFTEIGQRYHQELMGRIRDISGDEIFVGPDPYQSLTIHRSDEPTGEVLCVMHGGGWTNGYKEWMAFMAPALNRLGITFVSLGYRLAPRHVFPAGFDDCCDSLDWVYRNIRTWGGDEARIFVGGHSAGGHYAALMALRTDWLAARKLPSNLIKGALPISGTYTFGPGSGFSMRPRFLGPEENGADTAASPLHYVHADAPPFHIAYGDQDFAHLKTQADEFAQALRSAAVEVEVMELAGCDHLGASYASGVMDGIWPSTAASFMRRR